MDKILNCTAIVNIDISATNTVHLQNKRFSQKHGSIMLGIGLC